jgi:hypothetical protein
MSNPHAEEFQLILKQLREPFPPEDHAERDLPGGGKWLFVSWQKIRARLDQVCPDWAISYCTPQYLDKYCVVSCTITINGVSRQALGNAEIELLSRSGKDMSRGTPIERAIADAFKNAAESFGVCAYLDDQKFVARYLRQAGDFRADKLQRDSRYAGSSQPAGRQSLSQAIEQELQRSRIDAESAQTLLQSKFGKTKRAECSNEELAQFLEDLKQL